MAVLGADEEAAAGVLASIGRAAEDATADLAADSVEATA
jgi:hypothetical protein